jgi:hypothetical protein
MSSFGQNAGNAIQQGAMTTWTMTPGSTCRAVLALLMTGLGSQQAFAVSPRWIFDPIEAQVAQCVALGPPWDNKIPDALKAARASTARFLPSQSWDELVRASSKASASSAGAANASACQAFVAYYSDRRLSARIRGGIVAGLLVEEFAGCAAAFPDLAAVVRKDWVDAFRRNGFDPMDQAFDEAPRKSWRTTLSDDSQFRQSCERDRLMLESNAFDRIGREDNIKHLLNREGR